MKPWGYLKEATLLCFFLNFGNLRASFGSNAASIARQRSLSRCWSVCEWTSLRKGKSFFQIGSCDVSDSYERQRLPLSRRSFWKDKAWFHTKREQPANRDNMMSS